MDGKLEKQTGLFSQFLDECYSHNTAESYRRDLKDYFKFMLDYTGEEKFNIDRLDRLSIRSYIASLHRAGRSSSTIHRRIASLTCFFDFLRRHGQIAKNPVQGLPRPRLKKGLPPFISESELEKILDALPYQTPIEKRDRALMEVFYGGGLRLAEIIGLKLGDFDGGGFVRVMGKGSKERLTPLGKRAVSALADYLRARNELLGKGHTDALFVSPRGNQMSRRDIQMRVKRMLGAISGSLSPHSLRHAFATHMMRRGADLRAIQELLGHADLTATQVYTHFCPQDLKDIYTRTHPRA